MTTPPPDAPGPTPAETMPERGDLRFKRWHLALIALIAAVVAVEAGLNVFQPPQGYVEVINQGANPVENLRVRCDGRETAVGSIAPGGIVGVFVAARRPSVLLLSFKQAGNPLTQFEVGEFDPRAMRGASQKQVVVLQEAGVQRYMEDNPTWMERTWQKFKDWLSETFL